MCQSKARCRIIQCLLSKHDKLEDYECRIELYDRNGFMDDLENFVKDMPFKHIGPVLNRVLNCCQEHEHLSFGKWAAIDSLI